MGTPQVPDYEGYLTLLAAIQADQERQGKTVARVNMSVAEMRAALDARGWENRPDNRAAVVAHNTNRRLQT